MQSKKYGWDNFEHEVICNGLSKKEAEKMEVDLIKKYDSMNPQKGYNSNSGGFSGQTLKNSTKKKISEANKGERNGMYNCGKNHPMYGKTHTLEARLKISISQKGRTPWNKGKHTMTEEHKEKLQIINRGHKYNLGRYKTKETRKIISNKITKLWENEEYRKHMSEAHKGKRNNGTCRKVECNGQIFETVMDCASFIGVHRKTLSFWLRGVRPKPKKYDHLEIKFVE